MKLFALIKYTLLLTLLVTSCSVKKRTYTKGYYISWNHKKDIKPSDKSVAMDLAIPPAKSENKKTITSDNSTEAFVDVSKNTEILKISPKVLFEVKDTCGDLIQFKSSDLVLAKVIEITEDKVKYKRCDNIDGPLFVVSKGKIASIKYTNGVIDTFNDYVPETPYQSPKEYKGPIKTHPYAIAALLSVIFLFWLYGLGIILGLIFSKKAIREITANPKQYNGLTLAKVAKYICFVLIGLFVFFLLLVLLGGF